MSIDATIYEILISQKILVNGKWHVYDEAGNELTDAAGVLWRSNPGVLLMWSQTKSRLKYWNGYAWVPKTLKEWNGFSWQTKTLKRWNGTTWM